jgi:hypothetical protein
MKQTGSSPKEAAATGTPNSQQKENECTPEQEGKAVPAPPPDDCNT